MTLEDWILDRQENGDDGTGYNDYDLRQKENM